ncbi:hypothetical protein V2H45_03135 [Tumidithrix elongata RA019]|uniref:Uncharacterized protein n=1 Tax=Tumidithrix elongata BACA0141 TaxID=2716417 RepID=A0AAW9PQS2_9CYAN|nr:hypothetical protein [Tumidithrix elongata RA019]
MREGLRLRQERNQLQQLHLQELRHDLFWIASLAIASLSQMSKRSVSTCLSFQVG